MAKNYTIIADSRAAGAANREAMRNLLERDNRLVLKGGDIWVEGTITGPARYQAGEVVAEKPTRLRHSELHGPGPLFRLRGADMKFGGQLYVYCNKRDPAFVVEGSSIISTGWHSWRGLKILDCPPAGAWATIDGRYEFDQTTGQIGRFVKDPNHADNCLIDDCHMYGESYPMLMLDNPQGMKWTVRASSCMMIGKGDVIGCEIKQGGHVMFDGLMINCPRFKHFKPHGVNPHTNSLVSRDFVRDVPTTDDQYLTLFDDSLVDRWVEGWSGGKWVLRINGTVSVHAQKFDTSRYFTTKNPVYNKTDSRIDVVLLGDPLKPPSMLTKAYRRLMSRS